MSSAMLNAPSVAACNWLKSPAELYVFSTNTGSLGIASADVGSGRPDYYEQWRNWTTFEEFKAKYLEPIYRDEPGRYTVFLLR